MDVLGLLKEVSGSGLDSVIVGAVILLAVRYWLSEMRRDISKEIDDKLGGFKHEVQQSFQEVRQEIRANRTYAERSHRETREEFNVVRSEFAQSHKETMLHLIDVRERLANIEGRLGAPTPRMPAVSPPLEAPAEEPSTQS